MESVVGLAAKSLKHRLEDIKKTRRRLKDDLKQWLDEFKLNHGHDATAEEKEPVKHKFEERAALEKESIAVKAELDALKNPSSAKNLPSDVPATESADSKFSLANMRTRRSLFNKSRLSEIAAELEEDDSELLGLPKPVKLARRRWSMLRAVADIPESPKKSSTQPALSGALSSYEQQSLPPDVTPEQLLNFSLGDLSTPNLTAAEEFLRSPSIPLPPAPPLGMKTFAKIVTDDIVENAPSTDYLSNFATAVPTQELVVTSVPIETLRQREMDMEQARIKAAQVEMERFQAREMDLAWREERARTRVKTVEDSSISRINALLEDFDHATQIRRSEIWREFTRTQELLAKRLRQQKAMLKEKFGQLTSRESSAARRYRLMWDRVPQPIDVRVHLMKSVSSKLRRGDYSILMTMYDRLGGHRLGWTKLPASVGVLGDDMVQRAAATKPVAYSGKYFDRELRFDQSVYALCPSPCDVRPCNVLVFELFEMAGGGGGSDQVVGWGCLPMCDSHFRVVHGRFRLPFLRGPVDRAVKKYHTMERRYSGDLSQWLCNMYIDVRHMPREFHKGDEHRSEFDVEIDRIGLGMALKKEEEGGGEEEEGAEVVGGEMKVVNKGKSTNAAWDEKAATVLKKRTEEVTVGGEVVKEKKKRRRKKGAQTKVEMDKKTVDYNSPSDSDYSDGEDGGRVLSKTDRSALPGAEVEGAADNMNKKQVLSNWSDSGVGIKRSRSVRQRETEFKWHSLVEVVEMENYSFAVASDPNLSHKPSPDRILNRKLTYLVEELFEDLNFNSLGSVEFFVNVIVLLCALWLRMYFHFIAEWLFLKLAGVPLFAFQIKWCVINIKYTSSNITDWLEVGVVAVGQMCNCLLLGIMTVFAMFVSMAFDSLPDIISKFIVSFGVVTALDPVLVLIVDLFMGNFGCDRNIECKFDYTSVECDCVVGDAFKLWYRMSRVEASGVTGLFYTVVIYVFCILMSSCVLYEYVLHAHMNGRMLDNVRRLHAADEDFFVPDDLEIGMAQLRNILSKAQKFKGMGGVRRKVRVSEFVVTDSVDKKFVEKMVHVAIFTVEVDGGKTLYRHFLKQVNGAIVEIDDEIMERFSGQLALEKLMGGEEEEGGEVEKGEEKKEV